MKSLNLVQLIGNVTRDPEIKALESGAKLATLSIATNRVWKDKQTGEKKQEADFHNLVVWGNLADIFEKYVKKGSPIYVSGELRTRSYDKDGVKHYRTEINVRDMSMLGSKGQGESGAKQESDDAGVPDVPDTHYEPTIKAEDLPF